MTKNQTGNTSTIGAIDKDIDLFASAPWRYEGNLIVGICDHKCFDKDSRRVVVKTSTGNVRIDLPIETEIHRGIPGWLSDTDQEAGHRYPKA